MEAIKNSLGTLVHINKILYFCCIKTFHIKVGSAMRMSGNNNDYLLNKLSPKLMKGLAEYAIKEYREGHCLAQQQAEKEIMEEMGRR